jgi:uncharacterized protein YidB (DUF937 family)
MGLLEDVIGAALGTSSTGTPSSSSQSPIAMVLMALLASRTNSAPGTQQSAQGGLAGMIDLLRRNGLGEAVNSWIGTGQNQAISPDQLRQALGHNTVNDLSQQSGLAHEDLLAQLSRMLPGVIDKLTPNGQLPNQGELLPGPR